LTIVECQSRNALGKLCCHFDQREYARSLGDNIGYLLPGSGVSLSITRRTATALGSLAEMNGRSQPAFGSVEMTYAERASLLLDKYPGLPKQVETLCKGRARGFYPSGVFVCLVQSLLSHPAKATSFWEGYMNCIKGGRRARGYGDLHEHVDHYLQQDLRGTSRAIQVAFYNRAVWAFLRFTGQEKGKFSKTKAYALSKVTI